LKFIIDKHEDISSLFFSDPDEYAGVKKIAGKVMNDIKNVTGVMPGETGALDKAGKYTVVYGTIGKCKTIDGLSERKTIGIGPIKTKRESYIFQIVDKPFPGIECALVIAGSDKRGTIYGLFHLSEIMGVSPLTDWAAVKPASKDRIELTDRDNFISKEPSVRYRGFFINDEWPAFGNWSMKRFGGFNAKMYDHVFELLLRLKGNYLWPAMWTSCFSNDGPGLESAKLADEYGVVMGLSHHEPCLRHGEEYSQVRGKGSVYGDAWNFRTNREGIIRFWEDGLKRSGSFENVITIGMRGEQDTAIMGKDATLRDNIELLRAVLNTQNSLIRANVNGDLDGVPRMLALYKEVEPYFYGDSNTPGLIGCDELENVILMLCDDNFGNLRTLPTEKMRGHGGGYGMYYHFDYHGWPVSYEWINSSYLPKIWEQMTMAYEFGIRELWIVNVGDICTQEFPLSYFLDLAYDFERWGTSAINATETYTKQWTDVQFAGYLPDKTRSEICHILTEYTRISHMRRPEAMNAGIYHPANFNEAERMLTRVNDVIAKCEMLRNEMPEEIFPAFYELVYYPALGSMNLQKMQLAAGKNMHYARQGRIEANLLAQETMKCIERDRHLVGEYHEIDGGRWYGMGLSEHVGFVNWIDEECEYPLLTSIVPANKPRIIVSVAGTSPSTQGGDWTVKPLHLDGFMRPDVTRAVIEISCGSSKPVDYRIVCENKWLNLSSYAGSVSTTDRITVTIDRNSPDIEPTGEILIKYAGGKIRIIVNAQIPEMINADAMTFFETGGYVSMEAEHYHDKGSACGAEFMRIEGYGKTLSGMKVFPVTAGFLPEKAPFLEYRFVIREPGRYVATLYMAPSNPVKNDGKLSYGIRINDGKIEEHNVIPEGQKIGDGCLFWADGVLNNIRKHSSIISCDKGLNRLLIYAVSPAFILEKIVVHADGRNPPESYLGPDESYHVK
jgi:hypothetical protein